MKKVVFDTNIFVSALIVKTGIPAKILRQHKKFHIITAKEVLSEVNEALHYPHIQKRYTKYVTKRDIQAYNDTLQRLSRVIGIKAITKKITANAIPDDLDDNIVLACAVDGNVDYIVSGDPDLLDLKKYKGITILSPSDFLDLLQENLL